MGRPGRTVARALCVGLLTALGSAADLPGQGAPSSYSVRVTPGAISFRSPGTLDFNRGRVHVTGVDIRIDRPGNGQGGPRWLLEVKADEPTLGGGGKPASDLLIRRPDGRWTSLSTSYRTLAQGRGPTTVTTALRLRLSYGEDRPGRYGTDLTFRVSRR